MTRVVILASHAVAEYDDVRMFHDLGYDVFCPGGYEDPRTGTEGIRPPLPQVPFHADLAQRCREQREAFGEPGEAIDWAKARLHDDVIDWADVIIVHHFPVVWIGGQWDRIKHKRVIWRACGQSDPSTEAFMTQFTGSHGGLNPNGGLQIVRYSPAEERYFTSLDAGRLGVTTTWAGQDALIRFGKYPDDYGPWVGDQLTVGNVTQDFVARGEAVGYPFWLAATEGLPRRPVGKGSDPEFEAKFKADTGRDLGPLPYEMMLEYLRHIRVYLYTGTRPASYTLALIEAMMTGTPIVSIGKHAWGDSWGGAELFEVAGPDLEQVRNGADWQGILKPTVVRDDPAEARRELEHALFPSNDLSAVSRAMRRRAIELFGIETIGAQWREFLS